MKNLQQPSQAVLQNMMQSYVKNNLSANSTVALSKGNIDILWALIVSREMVFPDSDTGRVQLWGGIQEKGRIKKALKTLGMQEITEDKKGNCFQFDSGAVVEEWIVEGEFESHLQCDFKLLERASAILSEVFSLQGISGKFLAVPTKYLLSGLDILDEYELCILLFLLQHYGFIQLKFDRYDYASPIDYFYSYILVERKILRYNKEDQTITDGHKKVRISGKRRIHLVECLAEEATSILGLNQVIQHAYGQSKSIQSTGNPTQDLIRKFIEKLQKHKLISVNKTHFRRKRNMVLLGFSVKFSNTSFDFENFVNQPNIQSLIERFAPKEKSKQKELKTFVFGSYMRLLTTAKGSWVNLPTRNISNKSLEIRMRRWIGEGVMLSILLRLIKKGVISIKLNIKK